MLHSHSIRASGIENSVNRSPTPQIEVYSEAFIRMIMRLCDFQCFTLVNAGLCQTLNSPDWTDDKSTPQTDSQTELSFSISHPPNRRRQFIWELKIRLLLLLSCY